MAAFLPVSEIAHIGRQLADTLGATRRLYAVHNEEVAVSDGPGAPLPAVRGGASLEFSDVTFSYFANRDLALEKASFSAPAGSTVALVGSSGAGKTTAAHLLMRFFDPGKGEVRMNGVSLRALGLRRGRASEAGARRRAWVHSPRRARFACATSLWRTLGLGRRGGSHLMTRRAARDCSHMLATLAWCLVSRVRFGCLTLGPQRQGACT